MNDIIRGIAPVHTNYTIPSINDNDNMVDSIIKAGTIHKQVREDIVNMLYPGVKIYNISKKVNDMIRYYTKDTGVNGGIGFPPTVSLTNVIAHNSPRKDDNIVVNYNDNIKLDIGVHVNGWCVDSAFTCYFNPDYYDLHHTTKYALEQAVKNIGIESPISEIGDIVEEIVQSKEVIYNGNIYPLKIIRGLCGHRIEQYNLHTLPNIHCYKTGNPHNNTERIKEGLYAIEPFVSILGGGFHEGDVRNNYRLKRKDDPLFKIFNNMIFSDYHLEHYKIKNFNINNVYTYPPLIANKEKDMTCQYEHTVLFTNDKKIVVSQSDDY